MEIIIWKERHYGSLNSYRRGKQTKKDYKILNNIWEVVAPLCDSAFYEEAMLRQKQVRSGDLAVSGPALAPHFQTATFSWARECEVFHHFSLAIHDHHLFLLTSVRTSSLLLCIIPPQALHRLCSYKKPVLPPGQVLALGWFFPQLSEGAVTMAVWSVSLLLICEVAILFYL